jgi:predicted alpha/beta hydrolase family esterase
MNKDIKMIFVPGNHDDCPEERWRPYLVRELSKLGIGTINLRFPDPVAARDKYWIPFLTSLNADQNTILIGHSSGAAAAMRYAENNKILGSVLIGAALTHQGDEGEKESGYFNKPWDWQKIKDNQKWIVQFASKDDPYISIEQMQTIHEELDTDYYEFKDRGHFIDGEEFIELIEAIKAKLPS